MANPDIPAALVVLDAHLVAAGDALTDKLLDVSRGLPTGGRSLRYYWGGEEDPPRMAGPRTAGSEMVGQRFIIAALWPLSNLGTDEVAALDIEMQLLAAQIRTRINADSTLGGNVTDLELTYCEPSVELINGARHVVALWDLLLAYLEYPIAS